MIEVKILRHSNRSRMEDDLEKHLNERWTLEQFTANEESFYAVITKRSIQ